MVPYARMRKCMLFAAMLGNVCTDARIVVVIEIISKGSYVSMYEKL